VLTLVVCLLLLYIVLPQIDGLNDSLPLLGQAQWAPIVVAAALVVASYVAAAGTYQLLAVRRLRFSRTIAVQAAGAFANRVLPAGLGGLTLNVDYLRRANHTLPQAIAVAGANNLLGFLGHVLLVVVLVAASGVQADGHLAWPHIGFGWYVAGIVGLLVIAVALALRGVRRYVGGLLAGALQTLWAYRQRPVRLVVALGCSLLVTMAYVGIFYFSAVALGADISPVQALIIFTLGMAIGTATPTPGGLGGVEAGLVAGCVAYGLEASTALAVVLLYRLLSYWLPLLPGFLILIGIRKRFL
jgi:uncharacterized membrane protein YbhN (UPF0104 family)